jgi:hypothetical protein
MIEFKYGDYVEINIKNQKVKISNNGTVNNGLYFSHNGSSAKPLTKENVDLLREELLFVVTELERFVPGNDMSKPVAIKHLDVEI